MAESKIQTPQPRRIATPNRIEIRAQAGPQEMFLASPADIAIYGGSAGGGKSWALLLEALRHISNPDFGAVFFRRTEPQILNEGGLWDEAGKLYPLAGGQSRMDPLGYGFPSGAKVRFASMQYEKNKEDWQGSQIPLICFDELTHFLESQFFYMLSRNRSMCGVRPYIRGTCNPDPLSWVKIFLAPWIDKKYPDPAASGELRWFIRDGGQIHWVPRGTPDAKSVTFVRASIFDNKKLLAVNPGYLANLKALSLVDRRRLLDGDWDIVADGNFFRRAWFEIVAQAPAGLTYCRFWDLAATKPKPGRDPDWTVGVLMGRSPMGIYYILDIVRVRETPGEVESLIKQTAMLDRQRYGAVAIRMEREPGASGVIVIDHYQRLVLSGYDFQGVGHTGEKTLRAKPLSSTAEAGNVKLALGYWNDDFLNEAAVFPDPAAHDDQVDAASAALEELAFPAPAAFQVSNYGTVAQGYVPR